MPRPLFEVEDLRVAVFDQDRAAHGLRGPVSDLGQRLEDGWVQVLGGISFSVQEGEVLALIGESASGKSLALMAGFGLLSPGARVIGGTVRYRGHEHKPGGTLKDPARRPKRKEKKKLKAMGTVVGDFDDEAWAELVGTDIGFMFQNPSGSWTPVYQIGEQAGEALSFHSDLSHEEITERVFDALGEVKLPKSRRLFGAYSTELSRGMAQRAMLAAALTKAPHLLIADEPLNGLDPSVAAAIMELVRDMQKKRNMAVIVVTHDLAAVASIADRVAVLYGGEIIEEAAATDIYHHPKHPYTAGLIGSIPGTGSHRLRHIPGEAPRLVDIDHTICVFADRCEYVVGQCHDTKPQPRAVDGARVSCLRATELELPGVGQ